MRFHPISTAAMLCGAVAITICTAAAADDEPGPIAVGEVKLDRPADFAKDVLPILQAKCLACHSASKKEGGLVLESAAAIRKGGDSGPAVVAGKPDESLLALSAGRRGDPSAMPPLPNDVNAKPLTPDELGLLTLWIREGAKDASAATKVMQWQSMPAGIDAVYSLALDPSEQFVAAGRANRIHMYDIVRQREHAVLGDPAMASDAASGPVAHRDVVSSLAFSPDGQWLASGGYRVVKLWQRAAPLINREVAGGAVTAMALSADGHWSATTLADGSVKLRDRTKGADGPTIKAAEGAVAAVTFNADGTRLITAAGPVAKMWDTANAQAAGELTTPSPIRAVRLLPDGKGLASGHEDGIIRLWMFDQFAATEAVMPTKELTGHTKPVTAFAWVTAEGPRLLSGSEDGSLRQWDVEAGTEARQVAHGSPVLVVAATSDGTRMASAGADGITRVWDVKGTKLAELSGDPRPAAELARKQNDQKVAQSRKALADKTVTDTEKDLKDRQESLEKAKEQVTAAEKVVTEAKPKVEAAQKVVDDAVAALSEMPEDEAKKKAKSDADAALAKEQEALKKAEDAVVSAKRGVELSEKSVAAVTANLEEKKQRQAAEVAAEQAEAAAVTAAQEAAKPQPAAVSGLAFASDGNWLAVGDAAGRIVQWHVDSQRAINTVDTEGNAAITSLQTLADSNLITATAGGQVDTWRGEAAWSLAGAIGPPDGAGLNVSGSAISDRVLAIAFSPDSTKLAVGSGVPSRSGQLQLWNVAERTIAHEIADAHSDTVFDVAFSRDGALLASGAADKFAKVFDVATGTLVRAYEGHTGHVLAVAWKADGSVLATGGADNAIKAWTAETGEQRRTISSHQKPVSSIAFVGIEEKLVSAAGDNRVFMHTVSNGRNYRTLSGATDFLHAVVVTSDETRVIAGCEDGAVRVWNGTDGKLLTTFGGP